MNVKFSRPKKIFLGDTNGITSRKLLKCINAINMGSALSNLFTASYSPTQDFEKII
jgi:hypothetical protein